MSLYFNDPDGGKGIIQELESLLGFNPGDISGNPKRMKKYTAKCNIALDCAFALIFRAGGRANFDDANHADYNVITMAITSGQRGYFFTTDQQGNLVLEIAKILMRISSTGRYQELDTVDAASSDYGTDDITNGQNVTGIPSAYDKQANGFITDVIPNFSADDGFQIFISREASYFDVDDTTKMPGFAGLFHNYIPLKVAADEAGIKTVKNTNYIVSEAKRVNDEMEYHYGQKNKDEQPVMKERPLNPRTGRRG